MYSYVALTTTTQVSDNIWTTNTSALLLLHDKSFVKIEFNEVKVQILNTIILQ